MEKQKRYGQGDFLRQLCHDLRLSEQPELIRYYTNLIYDCGDFMVRLTPNSFRQREQVVRELHWLKYVGSHVPDVVQILGETPTDPKQFKFETEEFTVTLLDKIHGEPVSDDRWNPNHFERLGRLTGSLHRVGMDYVAPTGWELLEWDSIPESSLADNLPVDDRDLTQLNEDVVHHISKLPRLPNSYGPIHFDIHSGNYLLTENDRVVLFDFENSCVGHHINDIAMVLFYAKTSKLPDVDNEIFLKAFWQGYRQERPVPESEIGHIDWFMLNRAILVYGYLLRIWPDKPTWDEEKLSYFSRINKSIEDIRSKLSE